MAKIVEVASERVNDIASRIRAACGVLSEPADRLFSAQDAMNAASQDGNNTRLSVISDVAAMAHAEDWTHAEVAQACERAAKMGNSDDRTAKTVGVFISEMKVFASPKVRGHLPDIKTTCEKLWADETELLASVEPGERKDVETPVRKWQSRFYHLIMHVSRAVKDGKLAAPVTEQALIDYAVANDPDHNETKVAAKLKSIIDQIDGFHADFGMEELKIAADYLRTISGKELLASRRELLAARKALEPAPVVAPPTTAQPAQPAPEASEEDTGIVDGVYDYDEVDDLLGERAAREAAGSMLLAALCSTQVG